MDKEEFHDRLANPERYQILDWIALLRDKIITKEVFEGLELKYWEMTPGVHRIKIIAPRKSAVYSLITVIRNKFDKADHITETIELLEADDNLWFTYDITERNHIPT